MGCFEHVPAQHPVALVSSYWPLEHVLSSVPLDRQALTQGRFLEVLSYLPIEHASPAWLRRDPKGQTQGEPSDRRHVNSLASSRASLVPLVLQNCEPSLAYQALLVTQLARTKGLSREWKPWQRLDPLGLPEHSVELASSPAYSSWLELDSAEEVASTSHNPLPQSSPHRSSSARSRSAGSNSRWPYSDSSNYLHKSRCERR